MTIAVEKKLRDFQFWGGAASNATKLTPEELDHLENILEELQGDEDPWSATAINDELWFDFENVCAWLGLDYADVMARE